MRCLLCLLPVADVQRLTEWGKEIKRRFSNPLASTSGEGKTLELKISKKQAVNQIVIQENIKNGERIRNYLVQAYQKGRWITMPPQT